MKNIFAERMRQTMFLKGIRQAELVDKTGIDKGSLSSYVNGRYMPNADKIAKIATALGVSVNFLLGKEEIPITKYFTGHKKSRIDRPFLAYLCGFCVFLCVGLSCRKIV